MGTTNSTESSAVPTGDPVTFTAELKQKWIDALRSGEYEQARGKLKKGRALCCLGVLGVITGHVVCELQVEYSDAYKFADNLIGDAARRECAKRNDGGKSFAGIADYIEQNIPASQVSDHQSDASSAEEGVVP